MEEQNKISSEYLKHIGHSLLIEAIIQKEIDEFRKAPCPKGGQHNIRKDQLGDLKGIAGSAPNTIYHICKKCSQTHWPGYEF